MVQGFSIQRTLSVARKEFLHMLRDPATYSVDVLVPRIIST